ncbi:hypothetical protein OG875_11025 [Streptomyces sp. NBC_01498]|uniref:hypothetical protein n=1 Tax=Streptomyces sp. NBC_01498 TaxID=2975870 RepID=UPI002E7AB75A|nr:hypothetical protein [Streptomyces sp. NBC_01498]WTL25082.1 hypothetical protein OG875_11025 [Streptomyces sp. NBC_01498]
MRHRRVRATVRQLRAPAALTLGAGLLLAPSGVTPEGCGDLTGGRLCVEGPVGGTGTFTTRYIRHGAGPETALRLGYQRADARITAFPGWFGTLRTEDAPAALTGTLDTAPGECVRGLLGQGDREYVTEWLCPD